MPLLTLGPTGRFFSRGDARRGDVTKVPTRVPTPRHVRTCLLPNP